MHVLLLHSKNEFVQILQICASFLFMFSASVGKRFLNVYDVFLKNIILKSLYFYSGIILQYLFQHFPF